MTDKKKVVHIINMYLGGGCDYVHKQLVNMDEFAPVMLAPYRLDDRFPISDGRFMIKNNFYFKFITKFFLNRFLKSATKFFAEQVREVKPALIHAHFGFMAPYLIDLKRAFPEIPAVIVFYGRDASELILQEKWQKIYKELFEVADRMIVLCDEVSERFIRLGCPKEKITVWDIGIDTGRYAYKPRPARKVARFTIAARFIEKKGYFVLLDAFRGLCEKHDNARLSILGFGEMKAALLAKISEYGLSDKVDFCDTANSTDFETLFLKKLYDSDVFVLPSIRAKSGDDEGGPPIVMTNAAATGLPVISTNIAGIDRAVLHDKTGLLVESGDASALFEAMEKLLLDSDLRKKLGKAGAEYMEQNFSISCQMGKLQGIYKGLMDNSP